MLLDPPVMLVVSAWVTLGVVAAVESASHWTLPPGCPSSQEAEERLSAVVTSSSGVMLEAVVVATPSGYAAAIDLSKAVTAHRDLTDPDCDALVDAIVLLVALSIEDLRAGAPPPPLTRTSTTFVAKVRRVVTSSAAEPAATSTEPALVVGLLAGPFLDGTLVAPYLGGVVALRLGVGAFRAELGGALFAPSTRREATGGARVFGLIFVPRIGGSLLRSGGDAGALSVEVYVRGEVGWLQGQGVGVDLPRTDGAPHARVGADVDLVYGLARGFSVLLSLGGSLTLVGPSFEVDGQAIIRAPAAGARGVVAGMVTF